MKDLRKRTAKNWASSMVKAIFLGAALAAGALASSARADTVAATGTNGFFVGYVIPGVGFTFVPTTNLLVTQVGYYANILSQPLVRVWSGTNEIASYDLSPDPVTYDMVYSNVPPLSLIAGQTYSITLQDGPLSSNNPVVVAAWFGTVLAPEIGSYVPIQLVSDGTFNNLADPTNAPTNSPLFLGPDFQYQVAQTLGPPTLAVASSGTSVVVSWPSAWAAWTLQQNPDIGTTNWTDSGYAVSNDGTNNSVTITPPLGNLFFRLRQ